MLAVAGSAIRTGLQHWSPKAMLALPHLCKQLSRARLSMSTKAGPVPYGQKFLISLPDAEARFRRFCEVKGVSASLALHKPFSFLYYDRVTPYYLPFWAADVSSKVSKGKTILSNMHHGFGEGCSVYAGYEHNRLLLQDFPLSLRGAKPFDSNWLHAPLAFGQSGGRVKVGDWQVFPGTAWSAISGQVQQRVKQQAREAHGLGFNEPLDATVTLQDMMQVYVPVYHFEYSVFGQLFNVYISGCSAGAEEAGIDHGLLTESVYKHFATVVTGFERFFGLGRAFKKQEQEAIRRRYAHCSTCWLGRVQSQPRCSCAAVPCEVGATGCRVYRIPQSAYAAYIELEHYRSEQLAGTVTDAAHFFLLTRVSNYTGVLAAAYAAVCLGPVGYNSSG
jgi:hypothetical protein